VNLVLADRGLVPAARCSLLRRLAATGRVEHGPAAAVVLKGSSWNVLHADELLTAFPDTPAAFVLRDPLEVLVSLVERPPGWLVTEPGRTREDQAAIVVAGYLEAAARRLDRRWLLVRYEDLPAAAAAVAGHFGLDAIAGDRIGSIAACDVKHPGRPWRGDGAAKRARATDALRRAHQRYTGPAHERLLAVFAQRAVERIEPAAAGPERRPRPATGGNREVPAASPTGPG
jgi:hypothetical protein